MSDPREQIAANLTHVRQRIAEAAQRAGRDPSDVALVAVTKYVDARVARLLFDCGCHRLGESRPQTLSAKAAELADLDIEWHQIGHQQRNKVARTLRIASLIHSVDSERLLVAIDQEARKSGSRANVLLEVNVSGDAAKHGFDPANMARLVETLASHENVNIRGLMAMAALEGGPDAARRDFESLRVLRDTLSSNCPANVTLDELSMGMSRDFEIAIEHGATLVRIGSCLFEGIA